MDSIRNAVHPEESSSRPVVDVTAEDNSVDDLLEDLNTRFALSVLPVILYLAVLLLLGLVGNILSFVVYRRFKPSSTRTYILTISLLDLSNNVISNPTSIAELCFRYTFDNPWLCRVFRFVKSSQVYSSAFLLVAVALDRHRRVCQSRKKQQEAGDALRASLICVVVGTLLSLPYGAVTGRQTIPTGTGNLTGFMCSVDDQHTSSVLLLSYNAITGLGFTTCVTMIAVSYAQIGCHVWRHRKHVVGLNQAATPHGRSLSPSGDTSSTLKHNRRPHLKHNRRPHLKHNRRPPRT
ncbi:hypothetical protein C0Q70_07872 [Pomacea canaliculata]|uniref:G-protein coupled receptors family 1 profile domain-containing protein n=1 Tax=Pomacea canaliculata TaxID=400727 RepID=A0A2T7PG80_POMCA|nr:hypothetical protein C0Q70_07872 [Pomacea canaliculata]